MITAPRRPVTDQEAIVLNAGDGQKKEKSPTPKIIGNLSIYLDAVFSGWCYYAFNYSATCKDSKTQMKQTSFSKNQHKEQTLNMA